MKRPALAIVAALALAVTAACDMSNDVRVLATHDLTEIYGQGQWVGVSEAPEGGTFLLNTDGGIYRLRDGQAEQVASKDEIVGQAESLPTSHFHDIAALGGGRYALVADNDGFLYDSADKTLTRHFCYLPGETIEDPEGWGPDPVPTYDGALQVTHSLSYDAETHAIVAQPRTYDAETGEILSAHVARFDAGTGLDQAWFEVGDSTLLAGGLIAQGADDSLIGDGTELHAYDASERSLTPVVDMDGTVGQIAGLAERDDGVVLVLDGASRTLVEVELIER